MNICFVTCIYLWQISKIQTCRCVSAWPACPKTVNRVLIAGGKGGFDTICTAVCDRCDSSTVCRLCRLEPDISVALLIEISVAFAYGY